MTGKNYYGKGQVCTHEHMRTFAVIQIGRVWK